MADHSSDFTARAHINETKKKKKPTWRSSLSVSYDSHKNGPKVLNSPLALLYKGAHNLRVILPFFLSTHLKRKYLSNQLLKAKRSN